MSTPCSEVVRNLFVGGEKNALEQPTFDFDMVVNCTPNLPFHDACKRRVRIPIKDDPFDSVPLFQILRDGTALRDIRDELAHGGRVLVHCQAGAQRSPAVVACYLVAFHDMTPEQAIEAVKAARPIAFFCNIVNLQNAIDLMYAFCKARSL